MRVLFLDMVTNQAMRSAQLLTANEDLEAFSYSISRKFTNTESMPTL